MLQSSTLKFLKELKKNNNKPWFDAHRKQYEVAKNDFEIFIQSVLDKHSKNDSDLKELTAKKCMFRINRDVRFAKDKSPYKTNFGASMDKGGKKSGLAGYYFHLEPGKSFFGGGIWMPQPDALKKVRQEIDYCYDEFKKIITAKKFKAFYKELYTGEGVQLTKVPHGFEKDNPAAEYLKFKSWLVLSDISDSTLTSKELLNKTIEGFSVMQPFIKFLNRPLV
jgi:TIGR02453 family protein